MLVKLSLGEGRATLEEAEEVKFASIPVRQNGSALEGHLEGLITENVNLIEASGVDDDTLLIIGRQVVTSTGKVMDLVALDSTGAITLIEVKRDAQDVRARRDHAEIQAVRYAASLARLRTVDEIVVNLYAPYIESYEQEDRRNNGGGRSAAEWAHKKLSAFMVSNELDPTRLNHSQKIVLIGASFDEDTKSAAAWMAQNGLPLRVIEVRPQRLGKDYFLDVQQVIPPPSFEDFFVDLMTTRNTRRTESNSTPTRRTRTSRARLPELFDAGFLRPGEEVWFKSDPDRKAVLTKNKRVRFEGQEMSLLAFGKRVSGWGAVNVYDWMVHGPTGKILDELRQTFEAEEAAEQQEDREDASDPAVGPVETLKVVGDDDHTGSRGE